MKDTTGRRWLALTAAAVLIAGGVVVRQGSAQVSGQKGATKSSQAGETTVKGGNLHFETFQEWMDYMLTPRPYPKDVIIRIDEKHAYPHAAAQQWKMEIVREEGDTVWMRPLPPEDPESILHRAWLEQQELEARELQYRNELPKAWFVNFSNEIVPPGTQDALEMRYVPGELPNRGNWQMNVVLADMNEDGMVDLVAGLPRKGGVQTPNIWLGDGKGGFSHWKDVRWPTEDVEYDYGSVAVADFDGDGHRDVALAVHFGRQYVFYGDGTGGFLRWKKLPTPDERITSRAVAAGDLNGDGRPDLAFIAELNIDRTTQKRYDVPTVWVLENLGKGEWRKRTELLPTYVFSDRISIADVNGDGRPDLVIAANFQNWRDLVILNQGDWKWGGVNIDRILSSAVHFDVAPVTADTGASGPTTDLFAAFEEWASAPGEARGKPELEARTGVARYRWDPSKKGFRYKQVILDDEMVNPFWRVAVGDLNGDGRTDLAVARKGGELLLLVQDGTGEWVQELSPEIPAMGRAMDLKLVDLNGDGLDDLVVSAAARKGPGGIFVWLTGTKE